MKVIFESDNILFTEVCESLIGDYLKMVNDIENVDRYLGGAHEPYTVQQEISWVRKKLAQKQQVFSMIERKSGEFIGNIELMDVTDDSGELGIAITASKQDQGYGQEAVRALVDYGIRKLGLKKITLKAFPENTRAIHVYEKCGFVEYDRTPEDVFMEYPVEKHDGDGI